MPVVCWVSTLCFCYGLCIGDFACFDDSGNHGRGTVNGHVAGDVIGEASFGGSFRQGAGTACIFGNVHWFGYVDSGGIYRAVVGDVPACGIERVVQMAERYQACFGRYSGGYRSGGMLHRIMANCSFEHAADLRPLAGTVGSDIVVEAGGNVAGEVSAAMVARVLDGYLYLLDGSNVFGLVEFLVLLLGLMMLLYAGMAEKKKRVLLLPLFVVALVPGLYGLLSVFTGPDGKYVVLNALVPFFLITGIFGVFRLPGVIHPKSKWAVGLAIALVVVMGVRTSLNERKNIAERDAMLDWQSRYHGLIGEVNESRTVCMTDRAGYPAFLNRQHVVDLGGRSSIAVLRCVNDAGQLDDEKTLELARAREPDLLVLWEEQNYALASRIERLLGRSAVSDLTGPEGHPLVFRINWTTRN